MSDTEVAVYAVVWVAAIAWIALLLYYYVCDREYRRGFWDGIGEGRKREREDKGWQ